MKNILAFIGSPRRGGNSDVLAQHAAQAAKEAGAGVEFYYLNEMNYKGCQGCLGCKRGDACVLEDDLTPIYDKIYGADAIIFASPVYFDGVSGQMKSFLDRWYAFWDEKYQKRLKPGKKGLVILVYEAGRENMYDDLLNREMGLLRGKGLTDVTGFTVSGVRHKGDVLKKKPEALERAAEFGRKLAED
jgi:multimeric flavodoxin WrbA